MEKKIEVEIDGKRFRILEHMLQDASRYGATQTKRAIKELPKELLTIPEPKKIVLPPEPVKEVLPPVKAPEPVLEIPKKTRTRKAK